MPKSSKKYKIYYHATAYDNLISIIENGISPGVDGLVYLTEKEIDAVKFLYVRGCTNIITFKIKMPIEDMANLEETFDHSYEFFKCRCYGYRGIISAKHVTPSRKFKLD